MQSLIRIRNHHFRSSGSCLSMASRGKVKLCVMNVFMTFSSLNTLIFSVGGGFVFITIFIDPLQTYLKIGASPGLNMKQVIRIRM